MIILGIDPGLAITGFAIIEKRNNSKIPISYGCIRTSSKEDHYKRLLTIHEDITQIIKKYQPEVAAVEKLFFNKNVKTAIAVGQARGVHIVAASQKSLPVYEYTPLQVKQGVVGYGRAEKAQVQEMVKLLLNLKTIPQPDDAADALAISICHAHTNRFSDEYKL